MGTFLQVHLNDEDPNLQELLQAGRGGILMEDFVKYSLDMKLLDVQVCESTTEKIPVIIPFDMTRSTPYTSSLIKNWKFEKY